jgi:uncharacterized protein (DUF4415 family)
MSETGKDTKPKFHDDHDIVEWNDDIFERAEISIGGKVARPASGTLTRRGRPPKGSETKQQVTLRLPKQVVDHFKEGGPGWQSRLGEALERYIAAAERDQGGGASR